MSLSLIVLFTIHELRLRRELARGNITTSTRARATTHGSDGASRLDRTGEQRAAATRSVISRSALDELISELASRGFTVIGPTVRDRAILYEEISSTADLPEGLTDEQEGGSYRLRGAGRFRALRVQRRAQFLEEPSLSLDAHSLAGSQGCGRGDQLQAGGAAGSALRLHRGALLRPGGDRRPGQGLHRQWLHRPRLRGATARRLHRRGQLREGRQHLLLRLDGDRPEGDERLRSGSDRADRRGRPPLPRRGRQRARAPSFSPSDRVAKAATEDDRGRAEEVSEERASQMGRELETDGIKELLYRNMEHPRWDEVSERCLTCGNCTLVCPTCFCHTVEDVTDLAGEEAERVRLLGLLLHARPFLHPRRQRPQLGRGRATASG